MLGRKVAPGWLWAASGKHPEASDFFRAGSAFPLMKHFSEWVDKGYRELAKGGIRTGLLSWRFWVRGSEKEGLAIGLLKDSSDRMGRSYPFMAMGTGPLRGWEEHWDLLPFACEGAWERMESLSSRRFQDFRELERQVQMIMPPLSDWDALESGRGAAKAEPEGAAALKSGAGDLSGKREIVLRLDQDPLQDPVERLGFCHSLLKGEAKIVPSALFMGGGLEDLFLAVFARPLAAEDFSRLWSLSSERRGNGSRVSG